MRIFINWIDSGTDFFKAPASTQYHGACEGGLLEHSLSVYDNLLKIINTFPSDSIKQESIIIAALLHDVCKANFYKVSSRNVKDPIIDGKQLYGWHSVPYYSIEDQFPCGHGEKSVMLIQYFINLNVDELMAINWHMAGFDERAKGYSGMQSLSAAMGKYNLVTALHMADLAACYFDKK